MTEIKCFSGKPYQGRDPVTGDFSFFSGHGNIIRWLKAQTSDTVVKTHYFTIDNKEVGEAEGVLTPNQARTLAIHKRAENYTHEALTAGDGWKVKVDLAWLRWDGDRYSTWMEVQTFIDSDALAVQFKLVEPWLHSHDTDY